MKFVLAVIAANLVSLTCVAGAIYLMAHERTGWGWLIFVALVCSGGVKMGGKDDKDE